MSALAASPVLGAAAVHFILQPGGVYALGAFMATMVGVPFILVVAAIGRRLAPDAGRKAMYGAVAATIAATLVIVLEIVIAFQE